MPKPKRRRARRKAAPSPSPAPVVPASPAASQRAATSLVDKNPAKPVAEVLPGIEASFDRMREARVRFEKTITSFLASSKRASFTPCPNGGPDHPLDFEATVRASWGREAGHVELVFVMCAKCQLQQLTQTDLWLHRAGVPKLLVKASFENWKARTADDHLVLFRCRDFVQRGKGFLILQGAVGLGKTHLATSILRAMSRGKMITQNRFLLALRETYRNDKAPNPIEQCREARLLVLDELGLSLGGRDEFPALYEVLNCRHGEELPTVITTNVPVEEFVETFGDRIADRLATATFCELKGESWRKQQP